MQAPSSNNGQLSKDVKVLQTQSTGVDSTIELLEALGLLLKSNAPGKEAWNRFIKQQAIYSSLLLEPLEHPHWAPS
ncbi:hypothetical protein PCASD_23746 [Puccinia coronata f. sp. avenae]|uniref:Uncharacterized protein n=1 Tax=Puccinia coronata f. sp. avenae TaxID=200324 RepID=A0A2N5TN68_9BASI|nr:hypothetical protein PCASD_23746 [Puccinia coronata f. sp. avenae]